MLDSRAILSQASRGGVPPGWAVFSKRRGRVSGFLRGTSGDPDPLLVITEGVAEFVDNRKGIHVVDFDHLSEVALRVRGRSSSDSMIVHLEVWLDLRFRDGRKQKWQSSTFRTTTGLFRVSSRRTEPIKPFAASAECRSRDRFRLRRSARSSLEDVPSAVELRCGP